MFPKHLTRLQVWADHYQTHGKSLDVNENISDYKYVGLFCKSHTFAICLDIDIKNFSPENFDIPLPNWVTRNPVSGHSHAVWFVEGLVSRNGEKQENFLNAISWCLAKKISVHNCTVRNNCATQNPMHSHWKTTHYHTSTYNMTVLAETIDLDLHAYRKASATGGQYRLLGRNCALFVDCVRMAERQKMSDDEVFSMVAHHNHVIGIEFGSGPLPAQEVKSIANSICRYKRKGFSQEKRCKAATEARKRKNLNPSASRAKALGISKSTYYAKNLNNLVKAVKHALSTQSDYTTGIEVNEPVIAIGINAKESSIVEKIWVEPHKLEINACATLISCYSSSHGNEAGSTED